jgi:Ser/Thr protein kinase RdoA (MazF antagonist)
MPDSALPYDVVIERLGVLANQSLGLWALPEGAAARLINVSENATYLVETPGGYRSILRVHREDYHTRNAIGCEHAWSKALDEEGGVHTPDVIPGRDGSTIQTGSVDGLPGERHMAMFEFVEGEHPDEDAGHLVESFEELGGIAARTHNHSVAWARPANFERLEWDLDTVFGPDAYWGDWRDAPGMTPEIKVLLERLQFTVVTRLTEFGKGPERFGLIHADMRLANLIICDGSTRLIDFDDCGLGWLMYDFAAGISFMEDHPQVPALKAAWVKGYRKVRPLSSADENEIDTFVMLRRLALLAWIGSHIEVDTAKELAPTFAQVTAELAEAYLSDQRSSG